jgi:hypothetical protein
MNVREVRPTVPPLITPATTRQPRRVDTPAVQQQSEPAAPGDVLSGPEKEFFANAFPSSAADMKTPAAYRKDGATAPAGLGRMIDRKG